MRKKISIQVRRHVVHCPQAVDLTGMLFSTCLNLRLKLIVVHDIGISIKIAINGELGASSLLSITQPLFEGSRKSSSRTRRRTTRGDWSL